MTETQIQALEKGVRKLGVVGRGGCELGFVGRGVGNSGACEVSYGLTEGTKDP